jgi:hypothetical protein
MKYYKWKRLKQNENGINGDSRLLQAFEYFREKKTDNPV